MTDKNPTQIVRDSNIELLRIICMLFIICGHIIMVHKYENTFDSSWYINQVIRPFCTVSVNIFILITGYFGLKLKYKKLLTLNGMVTFYSVVFLIISIILGIHTLTFSKDWMQLLPVVTKQYWFITIYFILCLISPFLNILIEHLNKKSYKNLLITMFLAFVIIPTLGFITNFPPITEDSGYGIINFIFLYLTGRYIRLYNPVVGSFCKSWYLLGYFISMMACGLFQICYSKLLGFSFDALLSYDTIFVFFGAICLFQFFKSMHYSSRRINLLAAPCLAVYVLHMHPLFYSYFFKEILRVNLYTDCPYIAFLLVAPTLIYISSFIIEQCRIKLFHFMKMIVK